MSVSGLGGIKKENYIAYPRLLCRLHTVWSVGTEQSSSQAQTWSTTEPPIHPGYGSNSPPNLWGTWMFRHLSHHFVFLFKVQDISWDMNTVVFSSASIPLTKAYKVSPLQQKSSLINIHIRSFSSLESREALTCTHKCLGGKDVRGETGHSTSGRGCLTASHWPFLCNPPLDRGSSLWWN